MANKVLLKKSSVGAKAPLTSDLDFGELALNYTDGKLYYKTNTNAIQSFNQTAQATEVTYSNVTSGLTASDVQAAIDEVSAAVGAAGSVQVFSQSTEPTVWNVGDFWIQTA